jgi:predicted nucleic acid-binding protein
MRRRGHGSGRRDEHADSLVDAVSFEVMRRHRIDDALAFEGDFTRAGFVEVRD